VYAAAAAVLLITMFAGTVAGPLGGSTFVAVHRLPQLPLPGVNVAVLVMPSVVPAATVPLTAMATLPYAGTLMPVMLMTLPLPLAGVHAAHAHVTPVTAAGTVSATAAAVTAVPVVFFTTIV